MNDAFIVETGAAVPLRHDGPLRLALREPKGGTATYWLRALLPAVLLGSWEGRLGRVVPRSGRPKRRRAPAR